MIAKSAHGVVVVDHETVMTGASYTATATVS